MRILRALLLCFISMIPIWSHATERELTLKAGFLFNFARYSEGKWFDPNSDKNYTICSPDIDFVRIASKTLQKQKVKKRPVKIILTLEPTTGCHTLFLTSDTNSDFLYSNLFQTTMRVGQSSSFISNGGHISFFFAGGKIRFEVAPQSLDADGIKMSSKVLRMGRVVKGGKQ